MLSQKCYDCALKHCATALSYAKEILGGHAEGNPLDHRIDLLGELCNLEHHLELLDGGLLAEAQEQRRILQSRGMAVGEADLDKLRILYTSIEEASRIPTKSPVQAPQSVARSQEAYLVIIDHPSDEERFLTAYECLRENVLNTIDIVALNPFVSAVPSGVRAVTQTMRDFVQGLSVENFVYMDENTYIINPCDLNLLPDIYLQQKVKHPEQYEGCKTYPYEWDSGAPHVLEKDKFLATYHDDDDVLNGYYLRNSIKPTYSAYHYVVRVEHKLCCASRGHAEHGYLFATALDEEGFRSLREWLAGR